VRNTLGLRGNGRRVAYGGLRPRVHITGDMKGKAIFGIGV
jgi:hypothetical protein